jgi:hypothetical protein
VWDSQNTSQTKRNETTSLRFKWFKMDCLAHFVMVFFGLSATGSLPPDSVIHQIQQSRHHPVVRDGLIGKSTAQATLMILEFPWKMASVLQSIIMFNL